MDDFWESRVLTERDPSVSLAPCATHIKEMPCNCPTVKRNIENVFGHTHGLNTCMENII